MVYPQGTTAATLLVFRSFLVKGWIHVETNRHEGRVEGGMEEEGRKEEKGMKGGGERGSEEGRE